MSNNGVATRFCDDTVGPTAFDNLAIVGGGAWGTALALTAQRAARRVSLWARESTVVDAVSRTRRNPFLPSIELPGDIAVTDDLDKALQGKQLAVLVVPSQHLRSVARRVETLLAGDAPVVICSKGVEAGTGKLMSEVVSDEMPGRPFAVLSGPTFAIEVAAGQPTAATIASHLNGDRFAPPQLASRVAVTFATDTFRPYVSADVIGVEVGGATKNVLAIACGIAAGRGFGANARAALIARGLAEIIRLGKALGAEPETLSGLSGVGDLVLTCSDEKSRNFSFGKALGSGRPLELGEGGPVIEGAANASSIVRLASAHGIEMPICAAVERILQGQSIERAIQDLLASDLRAEPAAFEGGPRIRRTERRRRQEAVPI